MTDSTFIVFQDSFKGMKLIRELGADTLQETIQNIQEGSQNFMYYIYQSHAKNVPINGTTYDVFQFEKTIAGSYVSKTMMNHKEGLVYALTHYSSMMWFFTDNLFDVMDTL